MSRHWHETKKSEPNPFRISFAKNDAMGGYDVCLEVGALKDEREAKAFADVLAAWMVEDGGWKSKVQ